jgi:RNA polymerase sigma-70 factor (ECF subfamily)
MAAPNEEVGLIERSQAGDTDAFGVLVARYERMVMTLAFRMTGSWSDAEDLAQEVFVKAHRRIDSYRAESSFSTWLRRLAMNMCLDWVDSRRSRERAYARLAVELEDQSAPGSDGAVGTGRDLELANAALDRLPAKQRAAMVLTAWEGLSHAEAARLLGCTEATVSWRVFAARLKLRRWLRPGPGLGIDPLQTRQEAEQP